jgi:hypothetical protein
MNSNTFESDATILRESMKGTGTEEETIIKLTAKRSNAQRMKIRETYKGAFGRDLVEDLESELGGNMKKLVMSMYRDPVEFDTVELYTAVQGGGTDEDCISEIIGSRSNFRLGEIKKRFQQMYGEELEQRIKDETSSDYEKLLVSLLQCKRDESNKVDASLVQKDVQDLYNAGEGKWGTDEEIFNRIFVLRNPTHLYTVNKEYSKAHGKSLIDVVESEFNGKIEILLRTILQSKINPEEYFADRIRYACKGMGTYDSILVRSLVTIDEVFLKGVKEIYLTKYHMSLEAQIKDECSGDYQEMLLELIRS